MKPTLNEEIGMSQQGIDYVNSLEVKEPIFKEDFEKLCDKYNVPKNELDLKAITFNLSNDTVMKAIHNDIPKLIEQQRIRKQARNAWICVFVIILLTVILNWKS